MSIFNKENRNEPLTSKSLQKHIIFTIIGCFIVGVLGGFGTSVAFYYDTKNDLTNLKLNDIRFETFHKEINSNINEIKLKIGDSKTSTAVSDEKIKSIESKILDIQQQQELIIKTQFDILKLMGSKK